MHNKTLFDLSTLPSAQPSRLIRELPLCEQPLQRLYQVGAQAISSAELIAAVLQNANGLEIGHQLLTVVEGQLHRLPRLTRPQLKQVRGIGDAQAARLQAALELGRRVLQAETGDRPSVSSPADAANLLLYEMMNLEQEHLRVILLDTRNRVLGTPTIYIGSLNTSVVRVGELFRPAITHAAAAIIVVHNHPSGDPSPSPEDISTTRRIKQVGDLMDISLLDHIIIGRGRWVSLKERGLGFD